MKSSPVMVLASVLALGMPVADAVAQAAKKPSAAAKKRIARGEYLMRVSGCHDCHTPFKMGPNGPAPDMTQMLSGHPEGLQMPPAPQLAPGPWVGSFAGTNTAWAGPWGVSFSSNLTSDKETGVGNWTEQNFIESMRTGRHMGRGRPILPPMPWPNVAAMTDEDLKSIFAFLQSTPPIRNKVPEPIAPTAQKTP